MLITLYSCQNTCAPHSALRFSRKEKVGLSVDLMVSAVSAALALGIILASLNVPMGPLNALADATIYTSIPLLATPLLVLGVNLSLLLLRQRSRSKPDSIKTPQPPVRDENQETAGSDSSSNLGSEDLEAEVAAKSGDADKEKEIEPENTNSEVTGTYKVYEAQNQRIGSVEKVLDALLNIAPDNPTLVKIVNQLRDSHIDKSSITCSIESLEIAQPHDEAIRYQAAKYSKKYGIAIECTKDQYQLTDKIRELNDKINKPCYVGIISGGTYPLMRNSTHVAPLIVYFPGNRNLEQVECLIADSIGLTEVSWEPVFKKEIKKLGIRPQSIYRSEVVRQADSLSCRTEALVFLRNALLSIKYHEYTNGILEILKEGRTEGKSVLALPAEWIYTAQMNVDVEPHHKAIRSYYSRTHKAKSALEHRAKHTKKIMRKFSLYNVNVGNLIEEIKKDTSFPDAVKICETHRARWSLYFSDCKEVNMYLVYKAAKWARAAQTAAGR